MMTAFLSIAADRGMAVEPRFSSPFLSQYIGGGMGIRTPDIQLAKLALYQLSYTPALRRQSR